ncbi:MULTISPECIES: hypothetical protein [unclassified Marinovum]
MFDIHVTFTPLHVFAAAHAEGLQNASLLLGGRPWLRRCQRLLQDLGQPGPVTRRMRREAEALHGLLTLQHVHDLERPEAAYFSAIDLDDPAVGEICLLSEGLAEALMGELIHV